jgi:hypothetical protein
METLNREAEATDPAGVTVYSQDLIGMLLRERARTAYATSFSGRLARAELMARSGKRQLIPEETIARAFNELMGRIGAPGSLRADLQTVEIARRGFEEQLPAVISRKKNATSCYPGEAVWILTMLLENVGANPPHPEGPGPSVGGYTPPARISLMQFLAFCRHHEAVKVLDGLANGLEI